jgi:hypothetical protein
MLESGLPEVVSDHESIARFIFSNGQYNSQGAKPLAFMPEPEARETSVCRHSGEPQHELWDWSEKHSGRKIYGVAFIIAHKIRGVGLDVVADEPPPKHAAIRKWPWTQPDADLRRAEHKEIAAVLASESRFLKK